MPLNRVLYMGMGFGTLWGFGILGLVEWTGWVAMEGSVWENGLAFGLAGGLLGLLINGMMWGMMWGGSALFQGRAGGVGPRTAGMAAALSLWACFLLGGMAAEAIQPDRFHFHWEEALRGGILIGALGLLLGWSWQWGAAGKG
ncbi:MAG: hypothetical protein HY760_07855 [Nitrospirae bacterium]|nr:hypothetical protein [Nitrospirota bacterium]